MKSSLLGAEVEVLDEGMWLQGMVKDILAHSIVVQVSFTRTRTRTHVHCPFTFSTFFFFFVSLTAATGWSVCCDIHGSNQTRTWLEQQCTHVGFSTCAIS
jgi:hypothetical protein